MEEYRDIKGYEGLYSVSNHGNVYSHRSNKVLKPGNNNRYLHIGLFKDRKAHTLMIHTLVAMTFLDHKPDGTHKVVIDHIDNIATNNHLSNLQLVTHRHNSTKDRVRKNGLPTGAYPKGSRFTSAIGINGKLVYLGIFDTAKEASNAYQSALANIEH